MDMIHISHGVYAWQDFHLTMDVTIDHRSITAVLGPSGAGKSTLLNIIAGFETLTEGQIFLNGEDHTATPPASRPVSFVFQDNNSFAHMQARENIALGIDPSLRLSSLQWDVVDRALESVGIAHLSTRKPGDMSGGERQRIALARVLVRQKPILLLDEAFAALGPALRREMLALVKQLQLRQGLAVLMVTHQPGDAEIIADNVIFVAGGVVHKPVPTAQFFTSPTSEVQHYLGEVT